MGRPFLRTLADPGGRAYCCGRCSSHLAAPTSLISRAFHARSGRAYLFASVSNVVEQREEARLLTTGPHTVADVACAGCGAPVGWVYKACPPGQAYKTGRCCLEREAIRDLVEEDGGGGGGGGGGGEGAGLVELSAEETDDEEDEPGVGGWTAPAFTGPHAWMAALAASTHLAG
jgi:hypothetical protein